MSFGTDRVRVTFNPSDISLVYDSLVYDVKTATATIIDWIEENKHRDPRLAALAQTAYEEAAMWAVKLLTTPKKD